MNRQNWEYAHHSESQRRGARWPLAWSALNFAGVLAIAGSLHYGSEDWWQTMPLVYFPKAPLAVPSALLILVSLALRPRLLPINLVSLAVVLGPIMGFVLPAGRLTEPAPPAAANDLRLVSCNIQAFGPDFPEVLDELALHDPEIVVFQEVRGGDHPLLQKFFRGWHVAREEYLWVGSKHPVRLIKPLNSDVFERVAGLLVEIELPSGPICVADLHFMTARRALAELSPQGMLAGSDRPVIESHQRLRADEMSAVREEVERHRGERPLIALGDFNTPASSSLFQRHWGDLQSAFDTAGFGFGYTSPCGQHAHWFDDTPWVRIDHILCSYDWQVVRCEVGTSNGSDHRLIAATLRPIPKVVNSLLGATVPDRRSFADSQERDE